jgi:hypothetical protein
VGICVGEAEFGQVRCFSVAYRKVFAVEEPRPSRMSGEDYWGLEVPLKDEAGHPGQCLYHLVVETDQGRRELKLLVMR